MDSVTEGIIIGATGGGIAGLMVWLVTLIRELMGATLHKHRIYGWLLCNTEDEFGKRFRCIVAYPRGLRRLEIQVILVQLSAADTIIPTIRGAMIPTVSPSSDPNFIPLYQAHPVGDLSN